MSAESAIHKCWQDHGGVSGILGKAVAPIQVCPDRRGRYLHFKDASIHWSPENGAHVTRGRIRKKWEALNWETGVLGYPRTDQRSVELSPGGKGHEITRGDWCWFEKGVILWREGTAEAFELHGAIAAKFNEFLRLDNPVGFPETDELPCPDGVGRFQHFQHGSMYWSPRSGAHEVHGLIKRRWADLGWERSMFGYPTSDERDAPGGGRYNDFQGGRIRWTPKDGVTEKRRPFRPRFVKAIGHVRIVDDETFEDEEETPKIEATAKVERLNVPQTLVHFREGVGGEVRYELDLTVVITPDESAVIAGEARLYEGTSESTSHLAHRWPLHMTVPPDQSAFAGTSPPDDPGLIVPGMPMVFWDRTFDDAQLKLTLVNVLA